MPWCPEILQLEWERARFLDASFFQHLSALWSWFCVCVCVSCVFSLEFELWLSVNRWIRLCVSLLWLSFTLLNTLVLVILKRTGYCNLHQFVQYVFEFAARNMRKTNSATQHLTTNLLLHCNKCSQCEISFWLRLDGFLCPRHLALGMGGLLCLQTPGERATKRTTKKCVNPQRRWNVSISLLPCWLMQKHNFRIVQPAWPGNSWNDDKNT